MQKLLRSTTAYKLLCQEAKEKRLANTYLLLFNDEANLRLALKELACLFFDGSTATISRIERETHPDCLFYPQKGKALDKDVTSAILEESCLSPVEGKRKLFVLDNFHKASAVVQNKLLKVLEEPPQGVYFLLGATTEFPLLATVKSRAKKLEIPPFSEAEVEACLTRLYPERSAEDVAVYAAASDGSVGRAQSLFTGGRYSELYQKAFACVAAESGNICKAARALNGTEEKTEVISLIRRIYRDILFSLTAQPYGTKGESEKIKGLAKDFTPTVAVFALDVFAEAEKQIVFNSNLAQCVEVALWKIDKEKQRCKK
ncbi:MAG: hypothetical protein IJY26_03010 [Clostridia bacterium]|nr:hypothetical protein [Clostridia bacterium]